MDIKTWAETIWPKIKAKVAVQRERLGTAIPYMVCNGRWDDKAAENIYWWTNGFWPGILWLVYHGTGDCACLDTARAVEDRLDNALTGFEGLHHDVGFMWTLSALLDYRLTGNPSSRIRSLHAATLLAGRYNPRGHFIRAWNKDYTGWIIADCMMNLPLLYWASDELHDPRFRYIAMEHADTALKYLLRPDGSCNHIASLNPETGELLEIPQGQGYAPDSSWSRGQAWGLYGFALSAQHTGEARYLDASKKIAGYVMAQAKARDFVIPSDFRAPETPEKLDISAGVIAACGLLQLSELARPDEKNRYFQGALSLLETTAARFCGWDAGQDGIVQKCTAQYHGKIEQFHVPLIYGDYFFIEAIHRLLNSDLQIW
jgi:unsaturated chondroitin disaccharide hydrolase